MSRFMERVTHALRRRGWTGVALDDTIRSRIAHAIGDWNRWYDWGRPVMWLVGRYETGGAGAPRGRDLWWVPVEYVEGIAASLIADLDRRFGCYVTTDYSIVRSTSGDIEWRIYDLQDDGRTVKLGLWPNTPEHGGRMQPLPWNELKVDLFLWWYVWQHKGRAQWFGLRSFVYYRALHAAVEAHNPFRCSETPALGTGGYRHWHCGLRRRHRGHHRYNEYVWDDAGSRVQHSPRRLAEDAQ